jgi:transposase-like protein
VEQDYRFIKKRVRSMLGFKSFKTAISILSGVKTMHMIKKGQVEISGEQKVSKSWLNRHDKQV